ANPDYWDGAPRVETLEFVEFADSSARVNALLAGQIDATDGLAAGAYQTVGSRDGLNVLAAPGDAYTCFYMDTTQKPFDDVRVRQAMRLLVDRQALVQQAYGGLAEIGNDIAGRFDPDRAELPQREFDIEKARSLLKAAGQSNLSVELATSDISAAAGGASQVIVEQAKQAGVTVKLKKIPASDYFAPTTGYGSHAFGVSLGGTSNYLRSVDLVSGPEAVYPETKYKNKKFWGLLADARATTDDEKRKEIVAEMQKIEYDDGGYILPAFDSGVSGFADKVKGIEKIRGSFGLNDYRFERVSVES
ncbi:MAG TPA: ABC transporter substrate-binding protein, partial [Baekduia sp.]|nr:ABC transporter substrate-binding protein [Baekduia sp.]